MLICQLGIANFGYISAFQKPIAMNGNAVTDVADPTDAQDVATKNYIDAKTVLKTGDTMTGALVTPQLAIGTTSGGPEIDIRLGGTSSISSLPYGFRIRRNDNLAHCHMAWDAAGFTIYRVDGATSVAVCTIANGRLTALQDPANPQDAATKSMWIPCPF